MRLFRHGPNCPDWRKGVFTALAEKRTACCDGVWGRFIPDDEWEALMEDLVSQTAKAEGRVYRGQI